MSGNFSGFPGNPDESKGNKDALRELLVKFESFEANRIASTLDASRLTKTRGERRRFDKYDEPKNYLRFSNVERYKVERSTSVNTETMRRILDNIHDYDDSSISLRLRKRRIPGASWSRAKPEKIDPNPHLGPGCYEVDRYYEGRHAGDSKTRTSVVYSEPEELAQEARFQKLMREKHSSLNRSSLSQRSLASSSHSTCAQSNDDLHSWEKVLLKSSPEVKFGGADRWRAAEYKIEGFRKTTGLLLDPDFDLKLNKRVIAPISKAGKSRAETKADWPYLWCKDIDIDVDFGPKATVMTAVSKNPRRLAPSFRSTAPVGLNIPPPTTGTELGPGSFPVEQIVTGIEVKDPYRKFPAYVDRRPRLPKPKAALPETKGELPKFSDLSSTASYTFSTAGASGESNNFLAEYKAKKIAQIYPRFEKMRKTLKS
jgi:hypothetical protein